MSANSSGASFSGSAFDLLQGNTVKSNRFDGIDVSGDQGDVILANSVLNNATSGVGNAIDLFNVSGGEAVENNKVLQNGSNGIEVFGTSGVISVDGTTTGAKVSGNNDVENNGGDGIVFNGTTGSIIAGNTLKNNAVGIHLVGTSSNQMIGNVAENNKTEGFLLDANSTGNTVTENTAKFNGVFDAEDLSTGTGTAGTANLWTRNSIGTANPPGLRH